MKTEKEIRKQIKLEIKEAQRFRKQNNVIALGCTILIIKYLEWVLEK